MTASIAVPAAKASVKISAPMTPDLAALEPISQSRSGFSAQGLLIQLRAHHPTGCLLSELVQVCEGNYVVRALVQVEGTTIVTAMAAGLTIESAEDQARARVLSVLGIVPLHLATYEQASVTASATATSVSISSSSSISTPSISQSVNRPQEVSPLPELAVLADEFVLSTEPELEVVSSTAATTSKATKSKSSRAKATPTPEMETPILDVPHPPAFETAIEEPPSVEITGGADDEMEMEYEFTIEDEETPEVTANPSVKVEEPVIDLSDAIAQIGTEIDRIGWTKKQGSTYLQDAYGKRTRVELTEVELMSFLQYLKSLPSKVQPTLSELPF